MASATWKQFFDQEFQKPYFKDLNEFLNKQLKSKTVFPPTDQVYAAFKKTPLKNVKVVILGQDPYHGPGQAHGLSFSVPKGIPLPPSLKNIFQELESDVGSKHENGDLSHWAEQGVLLLNSVLTVNSGQAASHQKKGWETFTDEVIKIVNDNCDHVVFILWGSYAQKKAEFVDKKKHLVLTSVHPSPLSVYRGFFGSKPFSKANAWLKSKGLKPIKW